MELRRSCVLPNSRALPAPDSSTSSRVLREHSGNRGHSHDEGVTYLKRSPPTGNCYFDSGSNRYIDSNRIQPLYNNSEEIKIKSEEQIEHEFQQVWSMLQACEKYRKYREKKPKTVKQQKEWRKNIWPDKLERAFFKALVTWPPTGRKKYIIDGTPRGRNELVAQFIENETGIKRDRKQVSSHIQVLRNKVAEYPFLLLYMSIEDEGKKKRDSTRLGFRSRHQASSVSCKQETLSNSSLWPQGHPYPRAMANGQSYSGAEAEAPFAILHFEMFVQDMNKQPVHYVTRLTESSRLPDLPISDVDTWHKLYPELKFHRTQDWKERQVLVCHASIDMIDKQPSGAELDIPYVIDAHRDLSALGDLHCRTQFYDSSVSVWSETRRCVIASETSRKLHFGSQFWVRRMSEWRVELHKARKLEDPAARRKIETKVQRTLHYMTAKQDICALNSETGEQSCFLTILWRFQQTRSSNEQGKVTWRVVNLPSPRGEDAEQQQKWSKTANDDLKFILNNNNDDQSANTTTGAESLYPPLSLSLSLNGAQSQQLLYEHHPYTHTQQQTPPSLDLDSLSHIQLDSLHDFSQSTASHPNSATTAATDFSHALSLPSLAHSQDTTTTAGHSQQHDYHQGGTDGTDMDFSQTSTMNLHAINFNAFDNIDFDNPPSHSGHHAHPHQPHHHHHTDPNIGLDANLDITLNVDPHSQDSLSLSNFAHDFNVMDTADPAATDLTNVYPSKPWHFTDIIERMEEGAAAVAAACAASQDVNLDVGVGVDDGRGAAHPHGHHHHHSQHHHHHHHHHHAHHNAAQGLGLALGDPSAHGLWKLQDGFQVLSVTGGGGMEVEGMERLELTEEVHTGVGHEERGGERGRRERERECRERTEREREREREQRKGVGLEILDMIERGRGGF